MSDSINIYHVQFLCAGGSCSTKYLHEFHLRSEELVQGAYCGKDYVQMVYMKMYYAKFMPNDVASMDRYPPNPPSPTPAENVVEDTSAVVED